MRRMTRVHCWLVLGLAALLSCRAAPPTCAICERPIDPGVRAEVRVEGRRPLVACCPRCALHYRQEHAAAVRDILVTDHAGGGLVPLDRAFLVEGSDLTPCLGRAPHVDRTGGPLHTCYDRCVPSLIGFKEAAAARAFMDEHGGTLRDKAGAGPL